MVEVPPPAARFVPLSELSMSTKDSWMDESGKVASMNCWFKEGGGEKVRQRDSVGGRCDSGAVAASAGRNG